MFRNLLWTIPALFDPPKDGGAGAGTGTAATGDGAGTGTGTAATGDGAGATGGTQEKPQTFDAWLAALPAEQRTEVTGLYEAHTTGLRNALDSERDRAKNLEREVRNLANAEKDGSDSKKKLTEMADQLASEGQRADFYADAASPEIGLVGAKAAWLIIQADRETYVNRRGEVDFALLKKEHPYLFRSAKPLVNAQAGEGTDQQTGKTGDVNSFIRRAHGR